MRRARWKRKSVASKLATERKFGEYGSQLFYSMTYFPLRGTCGVRLVFDPVRRDGKTADLGVQIGRSPLLFPLPLPLIRGTQ